MKVNYSRGSGRLIFVANKLDEDGTGNYFETDQDINTTPTLTLDLNLSHLKKGVLKHLKYRLNPTNAVTYQLFIFGDALADNYASSLSLLHQTAALKADDTNYDDELDVPFVLATAGTIYYAIDWSGAPGNTPGYIKLVGEAY